MTGFDLDRLAVVGDSMPVVEHVAATPRAGGAQFAVSDTGTMVYVPEQGGEQLAVHWMDLDDKTTLLRATPAMWNSPQFSPDGSLLALDITDERGQDDIWLYDWTRDQLARRTFDASNERGAVWTPDGRRLSTSSTSCAAGPLTAAGSSMVYIFRRSRSGVSSDAPVIQ